jgi:trk system potassium uptake protein TrkH
LITKGLRGWELHRRVNLRHILASIPATQLFLLSFALLIALGTLGLLIIPGLYVGPRLGFVDALFTATSAVCVTGLIVVDTATYFTPLGQAWIALLIQLGGLGILTFTTLIISLLGRRATLGVEEAAGGHAYVARHVDSHTLLRAVILSTLTLEALGAVVLWLCWRGDLGAGAAVWPAAFHAISAFCNAGFSVFSDSLTRFQSSPITLGAISALIVTGGIGFIVLADLRARFWSRTTRRLATHTRLVVATTGMLLVGGTLLFLFFESANQLAHLSWPGRTINAFFMSVTARTAGFNTIDYGAATSPSLFLTILLMVIGGAPGSTAGGLKVTTLALLLLALRARLRGAAFVSVGERTIPEETVQRAAGLAIAGLAFLAVVILLLSMTELSWTAVGARTDFVQILFEAHSAFGTVGLSTGVTPLLSAAGRVIVTCVMFVGRVGPLTIASAMVLARARTRPRYRFPHEDVAIG